MDFLVFPLPARNCCRSAGGLTSMPVPVSSWDNSLISPSLYQKRFGVIAPGFSRYKFFVAIASTSMASNWERSLIGKAIPASKDGVEGRRRYPRRRTAAKDGGDTRVEGRRRHLGGLGSPPAREDAGGHPVPPHPREGHLHLGTGEITRSEENRHLFHRLRSMGRS
jgi:hypothetical protein